MPASDRVRRSLLVAGAFAGGVLAAVQILHEVRVPVRLLPGVAARVNGREIDAAGVERTVAGFDAALRRSGDYARARVVARMIDEELLVQHALDSGTAQTDPEVRAALVRAAINRVNAEISAQSLSEADLEAYYRAHRTAYASPASYQVTPLYFESPAFPDVRGAERRAESARDGIHSGQPVQDAVRAADPLPFVPPDALTTAGTLANYFGAPVVAGLERLTPGETTPSTPFGRGVLILHLERRAGGETPPLAAIEDLVRADALRERQEAALANLLESLHKSARIDLAPLAFGATPAAAALSPPRSDSPPGSDSPRATEASLR